MNARAANLTEVSRERHAASEQDKPRTLVEAFEQTVRVHNRPDALNYKRDGRWHSISSDEMLSRAKTIALGLHALGVRAGDRVAILSESRPEWTLADAGCLFAGAVDVPIYPTLTPSQARYILKDSGARTIFISDSAKYSQVKEALGECDELEHVILFDKGGEEGGDVLTLSELEGRARPLGEEQPHTSEGLARKSKAEDLATIIYTSGTTGEPKGVMLTHWNLVSNMLDACAHLEFDDDDVILSALPLSHILERMVMYMNIYYGVRVYFAENLDKLGENFRETHPTVFVGVPRVYEKVYARIKDRTAASGKAKVALLAWAVSVGKLYAQLQLNRQKIPKTLALKHKLASRLVFSKWREGFGGRIRLFVSGGAALSDEIALIYAGAGMPIVQGYGLTETSPVIAVGSLEENRVGTVGKPIRNVEVRIADDGEIEVRGPNVMRGYYKKPEATREVFTPDGWFKTGDIGAVDPDGYLRITDRKKELFKTSGGKYVAPQPIEQMIKGSRFVNQVVLVGDKRKFPAALIVPDWEQVRAYAEFKGIESREPSELIKDPRIINLFERQVASHTENLAQFEKVKRIALLENEMTIEGGELTPTMKVKRRVIDEKYKDVIDRIYQE